MVGKSLVAFILYFIWLVERHNPADKNVVNTGKDYLIVAVLVEIKIHLIRFRFIFLPWQAHPLLQPQPKAAVTIHKSFQLSLNYHSPH